MSVCTCTPKQKTSGRPSRVCDAHHGYTPRKARSDRPRKGSLRYEAARLASLIQPILALCDTAVESGATLEEILLLVKSGYRGAVKRKVIAQECKEKGHVPVEGVKRKHTGPYETRCKRCNEKYWRDP